MAYEFKDSDWQTFRRLMKVWNERYLNMLFDDS